MNSQATDVIEWLNRLGGVGFGTLLGLILFGNFAGIWMWTKHHREILAAKEVQLAKTEAEKDEWKRMTLELLTPLETTLGMQRRRGER